VKERNAMTLEQFVIKVLGIAKIGKKFSKDPYALENYEELYTIGQEMASTMMPPQEACTIFERDVYPTPNLSVRVMITDQDNRVLFVRERQDGLWSIPGGWVDLFQSVQDAAVAEALQEAGVVVSIDRVLAMYQREKHKDYPTLLSETCIYFHAKILSGVPQPGFETLDTLWVNIDEGLPPLSRKNSLEEIMISWEHYLNNKPPYFE
jgi:8-oxo-dGTP diphosphatase